MSASEIYSPAEEEAAFAQVYRAHNQKLLRYCQYRLRDRHEAEDVMQESFVRAWRSMPANAYGTNFYPWLRVVAGNLCTDVLRKRSRSEPVADIEPGTVDGGMDRITEEEDRQMVRQALMRLNDRHRSALMMREDEGLTYDEIAARTGVTSGTVESLLWRARQALKREFTVVAGRTGAFAPIPVLAAVAARMSAVRRRAGARIARRLPALSRSLSDNPTGHLAFAALATLTVVGGIAATFGPITTPHTHGPAPLTGSTATLARVTQLPAAAVTKALATASATLPPTGAVTSSPTTAASTSTGAAASANTAASGLSGIRVVNPVTTGRAPAQYSRTAPVGLTLGTVSVGISPNETAGYLSTTTSRIAATTGQVVNATNLTSSKEGNSK
jgi:RNA polymerase sigma-70 factor (ECF subfamily)